MKAMRPAGGAVSVGGAGFALLLAIFPLRAQAIYYYVNDTTVAGDVYTLAPGSDTNSGLAAATPKLTLQAILDTYTLTAGDVVYVDTGSYPESITVGPADSGSALGAILFEGSPNFTAGGSVLQQSPGSAVPVLDLDGASYVDLQDLRISGGADGIRIQGASSCTLRGIVCLGAGSDGVRVLGSRDVSIIALASEGNGAHGISVLASSNVTIDSSAAWDNTESQLAFSNATLSVSNTIIAANQAGNACLLAESPWTYRGDYNDLYHASNVALAIGSEVLSNLWSWQRASGADLHSLSHDPALTDDGHLRSVAGTFDRGSGTFVAYTNHSPCIDLGDPGRPFTWESAPNGSRLNIGLFGNTAEGSKSRTNDWVLAASLNDGGVARGTVAFQYAQNGVFPVRLELSFDNGTTWAALQTNFVKFAHVWDSIGAPNGRPTLWRVISLTDTNVFDVSDRPFSFDNGPAVVPSGDPMLPCIAWYAEAEHLYAVEYASSVAAGDWTTCMSLTHLDGSPLVVVTGASDWVTAVDTGAMGQVHAYRVQSTRP